MFHNFQYLNNAIGRSKFTDSKELLERLLSITSNVMSIAKSVSSNYAKQYSQVQWMKYDSDGNPTDVTPGEQNTVPDSILASAKQDVNSLLDALNAYIQSSPTVSYTPQAGLVAHDYGLYVTFENGAPKLVTSKPANYIDGNSIYVKAGSGVAVIAASGVNQSHNFNHVLLGRSSDGTNVWDVMFLESTDQTGVSSILVTNGSDLYYLAPTDKNVITSSNYSTNVIAHTASGSFSIHTFTMASMTTITALVTHLLEDAGFSDRAEQVTASTQVQIQTLAYDSSDYDQVTVPALSPSLVLEGFDNICNAILSL